MQEAATLFVRQGTGNTRLGQGNQLLQIKDVEANGALTTTGDRQLGGVELFAGAGGGGLVEGGHYCCVCCGLGDNEIMGRFCRFYE